MRLPNFRRLMKQDYAQEFQNLVESLSASLNYGIEVLYSALNNNLTLADNIACTVAEVTVKVNENGTPSANTVFNLKNNLKVEGVIVLSAIDTQDSTLYPPNAVYVNVTIQSTSIIINNIKGLTPGRTYKLKLLAFN